MLNLVLSPGGQVQLVMSSSDAVSLLGELGKIAKDDSSLTSQLLVLLKDLLEKEIK